MLSAAHKLTDSNSHRGCVIKTNNTDGKFWFPDGHAAKGWLLGVRHLWTEFSLTKIQDVNARTTEPPGENAGVFAYLTISILYYGLPW